MQHKNTIKLLFLAGITMLLASCANDDDTAFTPMEFTTPTYETNLELLLGDTLKLNQEILNLPENVQFKWTTEDTVLSTLQNLEYIPKQAKTFALTFKATTNLDSISRTYQVKVNDPYDVYYRPKSSESSSLISQVLAYNPAPGQFINSSFGTPEDAQKLIGSTTNTISLGAWGGSILVGFDHTIENVTDAKDFLVYGNAFNGLSEPGIVQVSFDANGNGLADDTFYELRGSAHADAATLKNYTTTYTNPGMHADVPWLDSSNTAGSVVVNSYHPQNFYPLFITELEEVSYTGTRVFPVVSNSGFTNIASLEWGYVDNYDADYATYKGNLLDIDQAIDADGNSVNLRGIDFIRIYTGAQVNAGALGELSTEIRGIADFSMLE
ncbi:hypothetical protein [Leeuwenhoekiella sp. MAR_2009_132]|uniref:hypothetical protein n=1 Tax=Leeuwenhoekiella sp. MAR_2009_132 TaxID=1392489 RepID=UPI0006922AD8|nr:hypothetical protein [Leeuwenhoekiella sp. MAR_2009_132]